jgi:hypothetical protein
LSIASVQVGADPSSCSVQAKCYDDLTDLPPAYEALFDSSSRKSFFLGLSWFRHFATHVLESSERMRIFAVESLQGEPLMALPMRYNAQRRLTQSRQLLSLTNSCTSLFSPLISERCRNVENAMRTLTRSIAENETWDTVLLNPLPYDQPEFRILADALRSTCMRVQEYFCFGNWYLRVDGRSYGEYFKALPAITQNTVQRKTKKFEKSRRNRIEILCGNTELEAAIDSYLQIYRASWKPPEQYPQFVPDLIRLCAGKGWLRLGLSYVDGQPAAAQFWIVTSGKASIYKLAYDERFSELSVGSILTSRLMQYVLDVDKVTEVDYLTGDDPYKCQWMSHRRERWGLIALNARTVRGCLGMARHIGGRAVMRTYRSLKHYFMNYERRSWESPTVNGSLIKNNS